MQVSIFQKMILRKDSFHKWGIFKDCHMPLLCFQESALKQIRKNFWITNKDFMVLAAGYSLQENNYQKYFDNPSLVNACIGTSRTVIFKSLKRLQRRGLITLLENKKSKRRFRLTDQGLTAIRSYTQYFNSTAYDYQRNFNFAAY